MSDLISKQEMIAVLNERARNMFTLDTGYSFYLGALHDVEDDLRQMPTIDSVPVKHGKWSTYEVSGYRKCSMCGGYVNWNPKPFLFGDGEYNYCPNCGACMTTKTPIDKDELAY